MNRLLPLLALALGVAVVNARADTQFIWLMNQDSRSEMEKQEEYLYRKRLDAARDADLTRADLKDPRKAFPNIKPKAEPSDELKRLRLENDASRQGVGR